MAQVTLIITNDYEIRGDGTGNVQDLLIRPTEEILSVCEEFDAPHTLFADVIELWRFREAEEGGWLSQDFKGASLMESQLCDAVSRSHDVQLHMHPQWIDAEPIDDEHWRINRAYWRLPFVPGGLGSVDDRRSLRGLFSLGRMTLEDLLQPVDPNYQCIAFRAGGYCIQPETEPLIAMTEQGFLIESSVSIERHVDKGYAKYDYRGLEDYPSHWFVEDSIRDIRPTGGLLEIPIFTHFVRGSWFRQHRRPIPFHAPDRSVQHVERALRQVGLGALAARLLSRRLNLDFCKLQAEEMISFVRIARRKFARESEPTGGIPLVMTGHSKEWSNKREFTKFMRWARRQSWLRFSTFPEWLSESYPMRLSNLKAGPCSPD